MKNRKYHTIGTVQKFKRKTENITLSEQFKSSKEKQKISHCRNSSKVQKKNRKYHTVGTVYVPKSNRKITETGNIDIPQHATTQPLLFLAW